MNAKQRLYERFLSGEFALASEQRIANALRMRKDSGFLHALLEDLRAEGKLLEDRGRYGTPAQFGAQRGTLEGKERGFGFFRPENGEKDLFIPHAGMHGAMHGDTVYAICVGGARGDEGRILGILKRGYSELVGTFVREGGAGYLLPNDKRYFEPIYIPARRCKGIPANVKAVAKITEYPFGRAPGGEIVEILGDGDDFFAEEASILRSYSLPEAFPPDVLAEADAAANLPRSDFGREDFRSHTIVTIDSEDTRDLDDAIEVDFDGTHYTLGVHIADVSEYVPAKSRTDEEAFLRGSSAYFPDRVIPMLPEVLSNGVCSLGAGEDRLTLSCLLTVGADGTVLERRLCRSVIRSKRRMTYREVDRILNGDAALRAECAEFVPLLERAKELTLLLSAARAARGSVDPDVKEANILWTGEQIVIPKRETLFSHELIEQCMVLANEAVAAMMTEAGMPFVYRVHGRPAPEKAQILRAFAAECGVPAPFDPDHVTPEAYRAVLDAAKGLPAEALLSRVLLRSMQKAKYSPENIGHFGLASACYCHFTSPIRRYPDLLVHRIVKAYLDGGDGRKFSGFVGPAAAQASERERVCAEAERAVDEIYCVQYMSDRIGETYDAVISGVNAFGLFAELENAVEGFLPLERLPRDEYAYREEAILLSGKRHAYRLGDRIRIRVEACDFDARRIEFSLCEGSE